MASTTLRDIHKIPVEEISKFTNEDLLELAKEAKDNLAEARSQKDWIDGIIAIKNAIDHNNANKNNINNILGGLNEQITDY